MGGLAAPQTPLLPWGGRRPPQTPRPGGKALRTPLRASAHDRTAKEYEDLMARNMMSNHTDMQDKYCGHSNDIHPIQSQYKGNHKRGGAAEGRATSFVVSFVMALNRVNIVAVNAILVLHVGKTGRRTVGRTPLGLHVPSPLGLHVRAI